eukprot:Skav201062  [mRNA]  locus=scaffold2848:157219:163742:- [translate_table: standard]
MLDGIVRKISGTEEALGLRLRLQGVGTAPRPRGGPGRWGQEVLLPTIFDASELRSDFNGKVMRSSVARAIHEPLGGGTVKKDEAYVELEAMKMIMPLKAGPGILLAHFQDFQARATGKLKQLKGANSIVQAGELLGTLQLEDSDLSDQENLAEQLQAATQLIECYLQVERSFAPALGAGEDSAVAQVLEQGDAPAAQLRTLRAHGRLK